MNEQRSTAGPDRHLVLITGTTIVPAQARQLIADRGFTVRLEPDDNLSATKLHKALEGVSGYLIGGFEEPLAAHFERASDLEVVAFVGTDFRAYVPGWQRAFDLGVAVVNTPGANAVSVAEFTLRLILTLARPLSVGASGVCAPPGHELRDRTLGIIGAGRIGSSVARAATLGFGMRVLYTAPRRQESLESALGLTYTGLDRLLRESDVITLHRPGPSSAEAPLIAGPELEKIRPGALLINTGHPRLVDPGALLWAIEHRDLRAAFDGMGSGAVWDKLMHLPTDRFLGSTQAGFNTTEAALRGGMRAAEAVCDVLETNASPLVNNPGFLERRRQRASPPRQGGM